MPKCPTAHPVVHTLAPMCRHRKETRMNLKPAKIDEIRKARCALRAEGKDDTMQIVREEKLPGISQSTLVKYWPFTIPETATNGLIVAVQESDVQEVLCPLHRKR